MSSGDFATKRVAPEEKEYEVAKVLASLGMVGATVEECGGGRGGEEKESKEYWGSEGKQSSKRAKAKSDLEDDLSRLVIPMPFDLNEDQPATSPHGSEDGTVKLKEGILTAKSSRTFTLPYAPGGRSRHALTEAENEARRLRRILANRESARQTIRRRQALYEELTRKAVDMIQENDKLKRDKDLVMEEFQSLQSTNDNLKEQISKTMGIKDEQDGGKPLSIDADSHVHSSRNQPFLILSETSATPIVWPACICPSTMNISQLGLGGISISPQIFRPTGSDSTFPQGQENSLGVDGQRAPWCVVPCPWILPITGLHTLPVHMKDKQDNKFVDNKIVVTENYPSSLYADMKIEPRTPTKLNLDENQLPPCTSIQGCSYKSRLDLKHQSRFQPSCPLDLEASSSTCSPIVDKQVNDLGKKVVDSALAAGARKWRRELKKLKKLRYHSKVGFA